MADPWAAFIPQVGAPAVVNPTDPWAAFQAPQAALEVAPTLPSVSEDIARTVPSAAIRGVTSGLGISGDIRHTIGSGLDYLGNKVGISGVGPTYESVVKHIPFSLQTGPTSQQVRDVAERAVGPLPNYQPQTVPGRYAGAVTEAFANPVSYLGPGAVPLKLGGAALAGVGGQAGEDIAGTPGRLIGGLAGGAAAAKTLGVRPVQAAVPTAAELKAAAQTGGNLGGYEGALLSGLELDPAQVAPVAYGIEQRLNAKGFTGGPNGTAKGTLSDIQNLQSPPAGSTITAANLDTLRATLGRRASEVATDARGVTKPTADAAAAQQALADLKNYTENIPASHVLAGNAQSYNNAIKEANANYAAYRRAEASGQRINAAQIDYERRPNTTYSAQLKNQFAPLLKKDYRTAGFTQEEKDQLRNINSAGSRALDIVGSRSLPAMFFKHAVPGAVTFGGSIPFTLATEYGARKLASALTSRQATKLDEMLRKRSPEYQQRAAAVPVQDFSPNKAALARALLTSAH